jgi:Tn3 transposase DDE domain
VFRNIVTLSRALDRLEVDGLKASDQALAALTPYQTEHINRFGNYTVNFSRTPEPLPPNLRKSEWTESKGQPLFTISGSSIAESVSKDKKQMPPKRLRNESA